MRTFTHSPRLLAAALLLVLGVIAAFGHSTPVLPDHSLDARLIVQHIKTSDFHPVCPDSLNWS
jgi:hypothetical protein